MHLVRRFFGFLTARSLSPFEQGRVRVLLSPELALVFFAQRAEDQRHAYSVMERVPNSPQLREAALLHDVGKTPSNLGAVSRALATLSQSVGLPGRTRWTAYLRHGELGADAVEELGASPLTVAFMRHHPGPVPDGVDPESWSALTSADDT